LPLIEMGEFIRPPASTREYAGEAYSGT